VLKTEQRHKYVKRFIERKHKLKLRLEESISGDARSLSKVIQEIFLTMELADTKLIDASTSFEDRFWELNGKQKTDPNKKVSW